ncbi:MAG: S9 family peptidase, partial [Saprospiraceae bacterium]|nr:S9 family peptidase [Saprospiraceae bacterium]
MEEPESYTYPVTEKKAHIDTYHDVDVPDPYHWLEDDMSDETTTWVTSQNEVTDGFLNKIDFKDQLQSRIEELYDYERVSAPFKEGKYEYFYKNSGLQNHSVVYRSEIESKEEPQIFLDPNTFSEDGTVALRGMFFTEDASMVAYMITEGGSDWRKVIVMDTENKQIVEDTLKDVKFSGLAWKGNEGFFYSSYDKPKGSELSQKTQFHKLKFHKLNTDQSTDELIYGGEKQPNRYINAGVTEDENYLVVYASQNTSGSQVYVRDLRKSNSPFIQLQDDYFKRASVMHNEGSTFYLLTNIDAPNYKLVSVDLKNPSQSTWKEIIPETDNVLGIGSGGGKLFADYLVDAKTEVKQYDMEGNLEKEIELPGIGTAYGFGGKKDDKDFYYGFTSFTYPTTIFKYDIAKGSSELYRQPDVDFEPSEYEVNQVFYNSKDGTRVPMFIVHKKGLKMNGKNPTYLYAYGGFNI